MAVPASLDGTVVDQSGAPIEGAVVSVLSVGGIVEARVTTDASGTFFAPAVVPGRHTVKVEHRQFEVTRIDVEVTAAAAPAPLRVVLKVSTVKEWVNVEASAAYTAKNATGGTKTDTPLLETPMAVQVVPRDVIEDRQERTSLEVIKNVSGVQSDTYQFYDQFLIRGFENYYGSTFRNGLQLRGINEAVNLAFVDHVEIVKGPSSVLYGRIEPGGFVNMVTKKPQETSAYHVEQQVGGWGFLRTTLDATGKASADGRWLYRVTGDLDNADSWVTNAHRDNKAVAATLAWRPGSRFDANVQLEYYDYKTAWLDASVPVIGDRPASVPRSFSIIYPESWSTYPYTAKRTLIAFEWSGSLGGSWKITNRFHYVHGNENQQGVYATDFDGVSSYVSTRFTHSGPDWIRTTYGTNLDVTGTFTTGAVGHKILIGVDWSRFTDDTPGSTGNVEGAQPLDIFNPSYGDNSVALQTLAATDAGNVLYRDWSKDGGVYLQDQMTLGTRWHLLLGGRYDRATDAYSDTYGTRDDPCYSGCTAYPVTAYPTDTAFSPRAGLLYKVSDSASVYGSYSKSFGSANGRDAEGKKLEPQIGIQYELGAKANLLGGKVTTSVSLFTLTKSNIPEYDPVNYFPHIVGEARSRGLELDLAGQVSAHLSLIGAYTYDEAVITKDAISGTQGNRLSGVAPHVFSLWAKWDTAPGARKGWALGAGAYVSAERQGDDANTWQLPGYGRIDALLAFRTKVGRTMVSAQLNVDNVLDRTYFDHGGYGSAAYGAPRTFIGSLRAGL
ncbi:MAG TPA: TonB-dependent siderophore receptor [Gemmatimonadales bacterium]|nr:TonB-dependent siderophore receptor [Gemmatimonadales bacterium]